MDSLKGEREPLVAMPISQYERSRRRIAAGCILSVHTLHVVAYWTLIPNLRKMFTDELHLNLTEVTIITMVFQGLTYLVMAPIGGILGDNYLGRYKAIFFGIFCELLGVIFILVFAIFTALDYPEEVNYNTTKWALATPGLGFGAVGLGFIKPNIVPFGAQQFESGNLGQGSVFFFWYVWCLNLGQLIAFLPIPFILRGKEKFNGLGAAIIQFLAVALSISLFIFGKGKYKRTPPEGKKTYAELAVAIKDRLCCCKNQGLPLEIEPHLIRLRTSVLRRVMFLLLVFSLLVSYEGIYFQASSSYLLQSELIMGHCNDKCTLPSSFVYIFNPLAVIIGLPLMSPIHYFSVDKPRYFLRFGIGIIFGALSAFAAGVVDFQLTSATSVFVQVPQFVLIGFGEVFMNVAAYEFAYRGLSKMQGFVIAMFVSTFGLGSLLSCICYMLVIGNGKFVLPADYDSYEDGHQQYYYFGLSCFTMAMLPLLWICDFFKSGRLGERYVEASASPGSTSLNFNRQNNFLHSDSPIYNVDNDLSSFSSDGSTTNPID